MEEVFQYQNAGKPLKARLKGAHLELMKAIVRLWQLEVGKYQQHGHRATRGGTRTLRTLRTNSKQLHKMTHRCVRTVRNQLNRLEACGWLKKTFHGSNASFELAINTDLLYLQDTASENAYNVASFFENPLATLRQFLPDTLSRVTRQVTKEKNELSGVVPDDGPATASAAPPDETTQQEPGTGTGYHPGSENPASKQQDTEPPQKSSAKKVPPPNCYPTLAAVVQDLPEDQRDQVARLVDTVLDHALVELDQFFPGYLVPAERERARACLAEYFVFGNPKVWKEAALQFIERVDLAGGWLERRYSAGKKAFLPLPSRWFDHRNDKGFTVTKAWYKTRAHQLKKMKIESVINRCLKDYWRSHQKNVAITPEEALRTIRQYLQKRGGPALFALFEEKVKTAGSINAAA